MITPHHRVLGAQPVPRPAGHARGHRGGRLRAARDPPRRAARPVGHAGHHLLAVGPVAGHHRGSGDLPDHQRAARRAAREGRPRLLGLRVLLRLRDLRGRHRSLLGQVARDRVPVEDPGAAAGRRARPNSGPDATGVGWVFQYALVDRSGTHNPDQLRSYQDWTMRYALQAVPGVAEVASIGGFVRQYQVTVDPDEALGLQPAARPGRDRDSPEQQRGGRPADGVRRQRVHGSRTGLLAERWPTSSRSS